MFRHQTISFAFALLLGGVSLYTGCSSTHSLPIHIVRSLRASSLHLSGDTVSEREVYSAKGKVVSHSIVVSDLGDVHVLSIREKGTENIIVLRYSLPTDRRIAAEVDDSIVLHRFKSQTQKSERPFYSFAVVRDDGKWLFFQDEQRTLPNSFSSENLRHIGEGGVVFRESGRMRGLCEAILAERSLIFEAFSKRFNIAPGETISQEGERSGSLHHYTLVENSEVLRAQCTLSPAKRISFYMVYEPSP